MKRRGFCAGEWFNVNPESVIQQALQTGGGPNVSDAYTINGLPGLLYNCSSKGTLTIPEIPFFFKKKKLIQLSIL